MKVSELTGAQLDYWVARAEGHTVSAQVVEIQDRHGNWIAYSPSTNWAQGGPLIEKHNLTLLRWETAEREFWSTDSGLSRYLDVYASDYEGDGADTALQAICRAVVRAKYGDEVSDSDIAS